MVFRTRASITDAYIVVLDVAADAVRTLLFDWEARRVEGFSAQLPRRPDAAEDCLDEMHRLVQGAGFGIAAVVGRAESDVTADDRSAWPAFKGASWFPALPEGAGVTLGCGCVGSDRFALVIGDGGLLGTIVASPVTVEGLRCTEIDEKRWLLAGAVPEAGGAYAALKLALRIKGSIEGYLESAEDDDPYLAPLVSIERQFREIYDKLSRSLGGVSLQAIAVVKSAAWTQRIADAVGVPLTLSTEPEPAARGAALWALDRMGAIEDLGALPASTGTVFNPLFLETIQ